MKLSRILLPIALVILSLHPTPAAAAGQQLDIWTWRNPLPTGNQLNGVTHGIINGNTLWVAVGANNTILTSPDRVNWVQEITPDGLTNCTLSGVVYDSSLKMFVAVGADDASPPDNEILTSLDGTNWAANAQSGGIGTGGLLAVACDGSGDFMAVGKGGVNLYSSGSGGIQWTNNSVINQPNVGIQDFDGVTFGLIGASPGSPGFVAVGFAGSICTTTDGGTTWASRDSSPQLTSYNLSGVTYDINNGFVAVGYLDILNSPDGVAWYDTPYDSGNAVVFGDNLFVTVGNYIYTSKGKSTAFGPTNTWTLYNVNYSFDAIDWDAGSGTFVAVGSYGTLGTSTDGTNWTSVNTPALAGSLTAIAYGATAGGTNLFVAGGSGIYGTPAVVTSTNGYDWQLDTDSSLDPMVYGYLYNASINGMAYGNNEFMATVNTSLGFSGDNSVIISSPDGQVWTPNYSTSFFLNGITYGMVNGGPAFVAVGRDNYIVIWSGNPGAWAASSLSLSPSETLNAVTYGAPAAGARFVAVGGPGIVYTSFDGAAAYWNNAPNPPLTGAAASATFYGAAYGNGVFVAVGSGGTIITSPDGLDWTTRTSGILPNLNGVTFANGLFVAVSYDYSTGGGTFISADKGVTWTPSSVVTPGSLKAVASGDYQYITVGDSGDILGSVLAVFPTAPGTFHFNPFTRCLTFQVMGPPGRNYGVYVSGDLINWSLLPGPPINFNSGPVQSVQDCSQLPNAFYYLGPPGP